MLALGQGGPKPYGDILEQTARTRGGELSNETALLKLADLKRSQASEEQLMEAIKNDPELARLVLGGGGSFQSLPGGSSTLGSLGSPSGQQGPMIQQSVMPGQPPGAPQVVPGGQDLSRFAPQGAPGTPTLATIGPQGGMPGAPQGPMQPQRNPVLEMAQRDPRTAMMMQQQIQGQQDRQWKMQEQQLGMGVKVLGYVAQQAQGVTDQASLDTMRTDLQSSGLGKYAAQLPQFYSKGAMEPFIARGSTAKDRAESLYHEAKARNLDMETRMFPELAKRFGMEGDTQAPADGGAITTTPASAPATGAVPGVANLSPTFRTKADSIADRLGANREDFYRVMHFETGGEFSPATRNRAGSGATGLIQFTEETARGLGTSTKALAAMTPEQQLDYVEKYLAPHKGKIGTLKDLYMAVLYPAALGKSDDTVLFSPDKTPAAYRQNAGLDAGNKGYVTVGDAVAAVQRTTGGGGGTTGTAQAAPADPRIAGLEAKIAQRTRDAQIASLMKNESLSTRLNDDANRLTAEKNRLLEESRRQQERAEETPRKVAETRAVKLEEQELERQRQAGPMLPEDRRKLLTGLRTDIRAEPTFKVYQDVRNGYQNVRIGAESDSSQGDLAIINGIAKILDPSSAVMTGEAKNVEEAQGQLQVWFNSPQRFFEGDRLTTTNRRRFLEMAHKLATEKLTTTRNELTTVYGPLAKEGNIDFAQLLPLEDLKPIGPGPNVDKLDKLLAK